MSTISLPRSLSVILLAVSCAALPSLAYADHSWGSYHWARTSNPFALKLGDNLTSSDWKSKLAQASQDWNSPDTFSTTTPLLTAIVAGLPSLSKKRGSGSRVSSKSCSMVPGTTQVCNGSYGNNGWLGIASIYITGGTHITQGTAKMNDSYFTTTKYNNPNEKLHVMCQESAHTLGLDHQSTNGSSQNSCMDYFSNTGANANSTISTTPNLHDFDQLNIIYGHLDSTTTLAAMAASTASASDPTDDPKNWGQLKKQSKNGRSSIYEKHNGDGTETLTHVYWTEEAAANCPACDHRHDH